MPAVQDAGDRRRAPQAVLSLLVLAVLAFGAGIGRPAITDADEAYYAEASREMVEGGDWLTPHFNYRDRWEKPVLYYWLTSATYAMVGPTEGAARLWAAISGIALVLLTWAVARRRRREGRTDAAWLAGAMVATSFGYFAMARSALPDLPLTLCITLTIWAGIEAGLVAPEGSGRTRWWLLSGAAAGLGLLMKGPVAVVVPALVLWVVWWRERGMVAGLRRGLTVAGIVCLVIGLPWYVAMWREHGVAYVESFFLRDNLQRFATDEFNGRRIPGYYLAVLIGGFLPWSGYLITFAPRSTRRLARGSAWLTNDEWRLLLWVAVPLVFFTVSVGQQPRYILPVLPPLAVLLAGGVARRLDEVRAGHVPPGLRVATWFTVALFAACALLLARAQPLLVTAYPALTWLGVGVLGLCAACLATLALSGRWSRLPATLAVASLAFLLSIQFGVLAGRRPEPVEEMAALVAAHRAPGDRLGVFQVFVRNLVFYTRAPQEDLFEIEHVADFLRSADRVVLAIREKDLARVRAEVAVPARTLASVRYLNTANLRLGTLLRPDPAVHVETVLLVTNR